MTTPSVCKKCGKQKKHKEEAGASDEHQCASGGKPKFVRQKIDRATAKKRMLEGVDPYSDPDNPMIMEISEAEEACERIYDGVQHRPCFRSHLSDIVGMELYLKPECFQYTGAFKERGCRNCLLQLTDEEKKNGVVTASSGNQAQAASYHGMLLGIKVVVIMPERSAEIKMHKVRKFGAEIIIHGTNVTQSAKFGLKYAANHDMFYMSGYDHPDIIAGLATVSFEILEEVPNVDAVLIPIGGGGLISGNSKVFKTKKPDITIIGIESERAASFHESMKQGQRTAVVPGNVSVADGIYVPLIGTNTYLTGKDYINKVITINEENMTMAMVRLMEQDKIIAEGAGAVGVGAILGHLLDDLKGKTVVSIISGGNVDTFTLCKAINRGIAAEGRLVKVKCWLPTQIGAVQTFCAECESHGAEIRYCLPETSWLATDVFSQSLKLILNTVSYESTMKLKEALEAKYEQVLFEDFRVDKVPYPLY